MSACIVSKEHIDAMVAAAINSGRYGSYFTYYWADNRHEANTANADEVGRMLWNENLKSIHCRYPDTQENDESYPGPNDFTAIQVANYKFPKGLVLKAQRIDPKKMFSPISCYEYQSCEHDGWATSQAKAFCDGLRLALIDQLGDTGPWGIDDISQVYREAK